MFVFLRSLKIVIHGKIIFLLLDAKMIPGAVAATCEHEESQTYQLGYLEEGRMYRHKGESSMVQFGPIHSPTLESSHLRTF